MKFDLDPVIFQLGALQVRWYGLMYVLGFIVGGYILRRLCRSGFLKFPEQKVDSLITHLLIGMFLGARLIYVFVYNWEYYSQNILELFSVWKGGLSFHGALIGMMVAIVVFARKQGVPPIQVMDAAALAGCPGLLFGRIGNFINGELWGRPGDVPWAVIFPTGGPYPRHPSQLYEGLLEGIVLFTILVFVIQKTKRYGIVSWLFMLFYGLFRFIVEFYREPDAQLGYLLGGHVTMGQILCIIMMASSFLILAYANKNKQKLMIEA
jgi:phosphatidylglycerol---prolipoprotein diacylglyceryl transferase